MGQIATNIVHFARILRAAGIGIGTGQISEAVRAVSLVDITQRDEFHAALFATLVTHPGQRTVFEQAFAEFWRDPGLFDRALATLLPQTEVPPRELPSTAGARRVAEAMRGLNPPDQTHERTQVELDARDSASADEILSSRDFEQMGTEELERARKIIQHMHWTLPTRQSRRTAPARTGHAFDLRQTLRRAMRTGGDVMRLERRRRVKRQPPLVVLCDISGSMSTYARMCLHFLHALSGARRARAAATHVFLFGTSLTNVTRALRERDPDEALAATAALAPDWNGGTRIAEALATFNRDWSRRVLTGGAIVLLITDGLERDNPEGLETAATRLRRSASRVIWLNPLLRFDAFAPKAQGIRALIRHVDELRPVHNLRSLADLADALSGGPAGNLLATIRGRAA